MTARHVSSSRSRPVSPWALDCSAAPGGRSYQGNDVKPRSHYVTTARAVSLAVPFGLPIISVPRIEITRRARLAPFRVPRTRIRGRASSARRERRVGASRAGVHLFTSDRNARDTDRRAIEQKELEPPAIRSRRIPRMPDPRLAEYSPRTLPGALLRVRLLSRDYTHGGHFRPSSAARHERSLW